LRAIIRGESTEPGPAQVPAEEPEDRGGLDWLKWNAAQNPQSPEESAAEVAAYKRAQFEELTTGKVQAATTRRIDCNPRTGVYTSQTRRRGGEWSKRRVVAVGRPVPQTVPAVRPTRPQGRNEHRPGHRRTAAVPRAGPDGDLDDEPPPARRSGLRNNSLVLRDAGYLVASPDARLGDEPFTVEEARAVAHNVRADHGGLTSLTPAGFAVLVHPYTFWLEGEQLAHAKLLIFLELPDHLRRSFYASLRADADRESDRELRFGQEGGAA
jgi:hypothetical protein